MYRWQWTADREYKALGTPEDICKCLDGNPPPWVEKKEDEKLEIDKDDINIDASEPLPKDWEWWLDPEDEVYEDEDADNVEDVEYNPEDRNWHFCDPNDEDGYEEAVKEMGYDVGECLQDEEESELYPEEKEYRKQVNALIDELFPGDQGSLPAGEFSRRMQVVIDFVEKWNENYKA